MGLISGILKLVKYLILFLIFAAIIVFIPNLPPYTTFSSIPIEPTQPRVGPLAPNEVLNNAERLYENKLLGPEAFQVHKGELYTSLASGEIVKINPDGRVSFYTKLGRPCNGLSQEPFCGRPLGFEIDETNNLMYVADAYYGIWKINLYNDKKQLLVSPRVEIEGRAPKLINFLAVAKNGDLYWSDSTSDFNLQNGLMASLADPSGRLLYYNAAKNQSKVLLDNLWFANGVAISPDNQFVVVAETFRYRLVKYYISGPKKGKSETFISGLPGTPDNLRVLPDGSGLLIPLYVSFDAENPLISQSMAATPLVRKFLARVMRLIEIPFEYLNSIYPQSYLEDVIALIGNFRSIEGTVPKKSGLLVVDWNGNIVESYFNTDGTTGSISDAIVWNNKLITGGPFINFLGSNPVPELLKKAYDSKVEPASKQKPVEAVKVNAEPKVQEKQAKPAVAKPVEQTKPAAAKPVEQPKPAASKTKEQPKQTPKPMAQPKQTPTKPKEQPKQSPPKSAEQAKQSPPKSAEQVKPAAAAKPKEQTKPTTAKSAEEPKQKKSSKTKPVEPEPEFIVTRPKEEALKEAKNKLAPENIPIVEEIPSDTAKPSKETLKVIKKGGPAEIPNPHL